MLTTFFKKHPLISIFVLAVLVRVLLVLIFPLPDQTGGDFPIYQRIADSILAEGNFGGEPYKTYGSPSINPGFAFFLAGWEFFFGKTEASLVAASVVLGAFLVVGTFLLSLRFFEKRVALVAGVITALWPVFLIETFAYGSSVLLYTTVLVWSIYLFVRAIQEDHLLFAICSGALLGFAALIDAIAFFMPLFFMPWAFMVRRSFRVVVPVSLFLIAIGLVIAPWSYRNVVVGEHLGIEDQAPIIAKEELQRISPESLSRMARLVIQQGVILSGLSKIFVFPYDVSLLDQKIFEKDAFSYKVRLMQMLRGESVPLSQREQLVFGAKIVITLLHWLILALAVTATVLLWRKREWSFPLLVFLLTGYVTTAVIGFGSLAGDDFQSISGPNSFLFPLIPLFLVLAALPLCSLHGYMKQRLANKHS